MIAWIPNALTVSRCLLAALVLLSALQAVSLDAVLSAPGLAGDEQARYEHVHLLWFRLALLAFLAGALTDFLDGWAARRLNAMTRFGVWLDPIADKLLVGAGLVAAGLGTGSLLVWIPAGLILARDIFLTWLRTQPRARRIIAPSGLAKVKTAVEMVAITALLLPFALLPAGQGGDPADGGQAGSVILGLVIPGLLVMLLWLAAILSLITGLHYLRQVRAGQA